MSDIDCMLLSKTLLGEDPSAVLDRFHQVVRTQPWAKRVDFVASAKIPVLKIVYAVDHSDMEVSLDLTCGHSSGHSGLIARDLIYSHQTDMPALRPLVMILKHHLNARGTIL